MNHLKTDPVGIDVPIDLIQRRTYQYLLERWGKLDMYGRVYKKTDRDGNIGLERYKGSGEYEKVLFSEGNKVFFVQGDSPENNMGVFTNSVWAVAILNLDDIYADKGRADEEAHNDLVTELSKVVSMDAIKGLEYGMPNLKRVVDDAFEVGTFRFSDIHPYHVFMVRMELEYYLNEYNC